MSGDEHATFDRKQRLVMRPVHLTELEQIKAYEIMENDLVSFESATNEEKSSIAFLTFVAGIFVPLIPTFPAGSTNAVQVGIHVGTMVATGALVVFFAIQVFVKRRNRITMLERLRRSPLKQTVGEAKVNGSTEPTL
ncbi:hypothetical protein AB3662_17845 [Sorangium cellulosum]|uniref:hypothetical protein n=1 Tax=Sorangium cellulosum TaxID=56 RepID=UPI003D9A1014